MNPVIWWFQSNGQDETTWSIFKLHFICNLFYGIWCMVVKLLPLLPSSTSNILILLFQLRGYYLREISSFLNPIYITFLTSSSVVILGTRLIFPSQYLTMIYNLIFLLLPLWCLLLPLDHIYNGGLFRSQLYYSVPFIQ